MAKHKIKRLGIAIDMTAMVDVAFLLLTFFMLTTQFREPEKVPVELPSSNADVRLPGSNILMLTVAKDGNIYIRADGARDSGAPGAIEEAAIRLPDLEQALVQLRSANPRLRTVIKADQNTPFGPIEDVMAALKDARITRFALITNLES